MVVPAGTRLGRYEIIRHLAKGGMADLLLARASGIGGFERHVVIKQIRDDEANDEGFVEMFVTEARLSAALHHQNIIQVHDIGEEQGRPYFAMEYLHGEDLRVLLRTLRDRGQKLPFQHVIAIGVGAASALHHAHEQRGPDRKPLNIVHRDVSPGNILVGYDGSVKVADFGIAKAAHRAVVTQAGTLKGKVPYMAPEQCAGTGIDRRSDVFSLGIVLYELATVRRLFKGNSDYETMRAIVFGEIPRPSQERPDLPPALEAILLKALARKPEDRYQTADEMRVALEAFAGANGFSPSLPALAAYMKQLLGRRDEPWLVDDERTEMTREPTEVLVDFDAAGKGLAPQPAAAAEDEVHDVDSLIEQARVRTSPALARKLPPPTPAAASRASAPKLPPPASPSVAKPVDAAESAPVDDADDEDSGDHTDVTDVAALVAASGAPRDPTATKLVRPLPAPYEVADSAVGPSVAARKRNRLVLGAAAGALALVALVVVIAMSGSSVAPELRGPLPKPAVEEPAPPPAAVAAPAPVPDPAPVAAPAPEAKAAEPAPEAKAAEPAPAVPEPKPQVAVQHKPTPTPRPPPTKPTKPTKPTPTYDPNSLFLKKP